MRLLLGGHSHGIAKTHLQHVLIGAALNFVRVGLWLADIPRAKTRRSPFVTLMAAAPAA
jgi:transposase